MIPRLKPGVEAPFIVPRLWPDCTMVCLGDGPSLTPADVELVREARPRLNLRVLAMNYSFRLAPWADVLWSYHTIGLERWSGVDPETFQGRIFTAEPGRARWPTVQMTGHDGLELDPRGVRHGNNSGYSALNLAVHLGAKRIILLGYDCSADPDTKKFNWFKTSEDRTRGAYSFDLWIRRFATIVQPLREIGVEVLNASRRTALECFPCVSLEDALQLKAVSR